MPVNYTSIVYNHPSKIVGLAPFYYRWRNCDTNLTSNTPANRYQIQKQIQNTVRVCASLYTDNKSALAAYQLPGPETYGVCWNQQSDRPFPSVQKATVPTGFGQSQLNSRRHSVTSGRPGCQTPGGIGCDIKHNSYDRYLNRLKGKGPLRRGPASALLAEPSIPFNAAYPVYGSKLMKTNIVSGCDCPITTNKTQSNINIYNNPLYYPIVDVSDHIFSVGENVFKYDIVSADFINGNVAQVNLNGTYNVLFRNTQLAIEVDGSLLMPTYKKCVPDPCMPTTNSGMTAEEIEALLDR
jgi:hypothetical protein